MEYVLQLLKQALKSEVLYDRVSCEIYSADASMYRIEPIGIVIPRSKSELARAVEIASHSNISFIPRGAATGVIGGCLGKGLIIDCSKHLSKIIEISHAQRYAVVQPGCVLDQLNEAVAPYHLCVGPDTSTSNRATIGGMVATNAAGTHSLTYGSMRNHILEIELILWNGEVVRFGPQTKEQLHAKQKLMGQEGKIYRGIEHIRSEYRQSILDHFPKLARRSSGYSLDMLDSLNIAPLIAGSEGTLGIISEIKIALSPLPSPKQMVVVATNDLASLLTRARNFFDYSLFSFEMIDRMVLEAAKAASIVNRSLQQPLYLLPEIPDALLIFECDTESFSHLVQYAKSLPETLFVRAVVDPAEQKAMWALRKAGLGLLLSKRSYTQAIAFIEDMAVPLDKLPLFFKNIQKLLHKYKKQAGIYGHLGAGCLHIRPYFDTRDPHQLAEMQQLMNEAIALVCEYHGVLSSEHGDGLARSWSTKELFGDRLYEAMCQLKHAFDPYNKMNPGKIVHAAQSLTEHVRFGPNTSTTPFTPYLDFSRQGGLPLAADMCNGNGACRKKEGIMCPSYQATHDEKDTTRARARALQGVLHGTIDRKELFSPNFQKVMELCIQCKGCKSECPSQVDMAKMKSEYLHQLHKKIPRGLRERLFAYLPRLLHLASFFPRIANAMQRLSFFIGVSSEQSLPQLACTRFSSLFARHTKKSHPKKVVLFVDTFTEFLYPALGLDAVRVLEAIGFSVIAPEWRCCGRTLFSKGYLPEAKERLEKLMAQLLPYAREGLAIVGLEPSCLLTLRDELHDFGFDPKSVETVGNASMLIDEFLAQHLDALQQQVTAYPASVQVHGHCHQKSLCGMQAQLTILRKVVKGEVYDIPSGCCGMAGSFGYEEEHAALSKRIGKLVLVPHIQAHDACIIASGTSCRTQIETLTGRKPLHFIEFISSLLIPTPHS